MAEFKRLNEIVPDPFVCVCEDGECRIDGTLNVLTEPNETSEGVDVSVPGAGSVQATPGEPTTNSNNVTTTPYTFSISVECGQSHEVTAVATIIIDNKVQSTQTVPCESCGEED